MDDTPLTGGETPIALHSEHGPLPGWLSIPAAPAGLVVLARAGDAGQAPEADASALAAELRRTGLAVLSLDLLAHQEERYADAVNNVPLLSRRLLDCLALLKRRMRNDELPPLPIGLYGAGPASPAVVRVAALRDHDIAALVCRNGIIDLAGVLYLHALASPLLILLDAAEERLLAANQRARRELSCPNALEILPPGADANAAGASARLAADWFSRHFHALALPSGR